MSVAAGGALAASGHYTVSGMWWVAALFTALRLVGNAACVARETAAMKEFCDSVDGQASGLCELAGVPESRVKTVRPSTPALVSSPPCACAMLFAFVAMVR